MDHNFYSLKVIDVKKETDQAVSLFFEVPETLSETFKYTQGQYLTLKFFINGNEERRAYSMCSSPLEPYLAVTVKKVPKGLVSNHIFNEVHTGQTIEVMPPQGRFFTTLDASQRKTYYLIAAGSGITPIFSILKTILEEEPQSSIHLLYGNRDEESIIFKEHLDHLQKKYEGQLFIEYILSKPKREKSKGLSGFFSKGKTAWEGKTGRINNLVIDKYLAENPPKYKEVEYFICGPGDMIDLVKISLLRRSIDEKHIHTERFVSKNDSVVTNKGVEGAIAHVELDGQQIEVIVKESKSILSALLDAKYDPPYSCTSGACSTCMAKILEGKVKMDACYALDDEEIANGYVLTCQAHPTTEVVKLTFNV